MVRAILTEILSVEWTFASYFSKARFHPPGVKSIIHNGNIYEQHKNK